MKTNFILKQDPRILFSNKKKSLKKGKKPFYKSYLAVKPRSLVRGPDVLVEVGPRLEALRTFRTPVRTIVAMSVSSMLSQVRSISKNFRTRVATKSDRFRGLGRLNLQPFVAGIWWGGRWRRRQAVYRIRRRGRGR